MDRWMDEMQGVKGIEVWFVVQEVPQYNYILLTFTMWIT